MFWGGPLSLLLLEDNKIEMRKIHLLGKFFINDTGLYMISEKTMYRHNKQPVLICDAQGKKISKKFSDDYQHSYLNRDFVRCRNLLDVMYPEITKGKNYANIHDAMHDIVREIKHVTISLDMADLFDEINACPPTVLRQLQELTQQAREAVLNMSAQKIKTALPMGLIFGGFLIFYLILQQGDSLINLIPSYSGPVPDP